MPNFTKGKTFTSTEELTNIKLHQLVEDASMNVTAITSLTALTDPVADTDTLPIADDSATAIRKVAASNFLKKNSSSVYDAGTTRVTGVATPTNASDATTKAYVDSIAVVAGNLPSVTTANNGSLLRVSSGNWTTTASDAVSTAQIQNLAVTGAKLEDSGATAGTYGGSTSIPQITVDAKGRITSAIAFNATPADGTVTSAKMADLSPSPAGTYGSGSVVPVLTLNAKGQVTSVATATVGAAVGFRNRIINGDMRIDQRNAGASVTNGTTDAYCLDRFTIAGTVASKFTAQRSTTAPSGFTNSLLITSSSAYTVGASDFFYVMQGIEGSNVSDLAFGSASAQSITISFWVRSSITGTFGGAVRNKIAGADRSYPFSYSISASNTWEKKTITVAGDTSGTWTTDNSCSITVCIGLGVGTTYSGTSGSWAGSNLVSSSSATSVVGTNGATFYITGVQLEAGSTATDFERRLYGTELALCQRYYLKKSAVAVNGLALSGNAVVANVQQDFPDTFPTMRASPSASISSASDFTIYVNAVTRAATNLQSAGTSPSSCWWITQNNNIGAQASLTLYASSATAFLAYSSEL